MIPSPSIPHIRKIETLVRQARMAAFALPVYDGDIQQNQWIVNASRWYHPPHVALIIFTRDNLVRLGFWKNTEYENSLHLSISFRSPVRYEPLGWNQRSADHLARAFFGEDRTKLWWEPAYTERGKQLPVGHYRLFFDPLWERAIVPKGEPYSTGMGGVAMERWTDAQADLPTPNFNADITDELPLRRPEGAP